MQIKIARTLCLIALGLLITGCLPESKMNIDLQSDDSQEEGGTAEGSAKSKDPEEKKSSQANTKGGNQEGQGDKTVDETLSNENKQKKEADFDDVKAKTTDCDGASCVFLIKNGKEIEIDKNKEGLSYDRVEFSPKGSYLIYSGTGENWVITRVYDVKNDKIMKLDSRENVFTSEVLFTPNEEYAYYCASQGMASGGASVYKVPSFENVFNALERQDIKDFSNFNPLRIECSYEEDKKEINFKFFSSDLGMEEKKNNETKEISFSVEEGKVVE